MRAILGVNTVFYNLCDSTYDMTCKRDHKPTSPTMMGPNETNKELRHYCSGTICFVYSMKRILASDRSTSRKLYFHAYSASRFQVDTSNILRPVAC